MWPGRQGQERASGAQVEALHQLVDSDKTSAYLGELAERIQRLATVDDAGDLASGLQSVTASIEQLATSDAVSEVQTGVSNVETATSSMRERITELATAAQVNGLFELMESDGSVTTALDRLASLVATRPGAEDLEALRDEVAAATAGQRALAAAIESVRGAIVDAPAPATPEDVVDLGGRLEESMGGHVRAISAFQQSTASQLSEGQAALVALAEQLMGDGATQAQLAELRAHLDATLASMKRGADAQRAELATAEVLASIQDRVRVTASATQIEMLLDRFDGLATLAQVQSLESAVGAVIDDPTLATLTEHVRALAIAQREVTARIDTVHHALGEVHYPKELAALADMQAMIAAVARRPSPASIDDIRRSMDEVLQPVSSALRDDIDRRIADVATVQDLRELRSHLETLGDDARREITVRLAHLASASGLDSIRDKLVEVATTADIERVVEQLGRLPTTRQLLDVDDIDARLDRLTQQRTSRSAEADDDPTGGPGSSGG